MTTAEIAEWCAASNKSGGACLSQTFSRYLGIPICQRHFDQITAELAPLIEAARAYRDAKVEFVNDMTIDKRVILMTAESHLMTAITELEAARTFEVSHEEQG